MRRDKNWSNEAYSFILNMSSLMKYAFIFEADK